MTAEAEQKRGSGSGRRIIAIIIVAGRLLLGLAVVIPPILSAQEVRASYASHISNIKSENLTLVDRAYESDATPVVTGNSLLSISQTTADFRDSAGSREREGRLVSRFNA